MKKLLLISLLSVAALNVFGQADNVQTGTDKVCKPLANMPKKAVQVWPQSAYVPLSDPKCAPCYEYKGKFGTTVMECPQARFLLENDNVTDRSNAVNAGNNNNVSMEAQSAYTGNYPICRKPANMPANAVMVWPKGEYTPTGDPKCAPCYQYRTAKGTEVMECPYLRWK
jgi:hypothetical protein